MLRLLLLRATTLPGVETFWCPERVSGGDIFWIFLHLSQFSEKFRSAGVVTSPDYPSNYPNDLEETKTIEVEQGMIMSLEFTAFDVERNSKCVYDHLTILDDNGAILMEKSCGSDGNLVIGGKKLNSTMPPKVWSRSNKVNFVFVTDGGGTRPGWSINWSAATSGECLFFVSSL